MSSETMPRRLISEVQLGNHKDIYLSPISQMAFREFTVLALLIEKMNRISAFPLVQTLIFITHY